VKVERRTILKALLGVAGAAIAVPLAGLAAFINPPYKFVPVRMKIDGASQMKNNSVLYFLWPTDVRPLDTNLLIRDDSGKYSAYNRVCTHLQCVVNYDPQTERILCVCHGSSYEAKSGSVLGGPAPRALPKILLELDQNGDVYAVNVEGVFGYGR
jgi:rieske iron-sulfur protein